VVGELVEKRLIIFTQSLPDKKKAVPLHSQTTKRAAGNQKKQAVGTLKQALMSTSRPTKTSHSTESTQSLYLLRKW
jgi:hypothetical protein